MFTDINSYKIYFNNNYEQALLYARLLFKIIEISLKFIYHLKFWDTAGQEQFNAINTMYYQNAVGALLVYDVTIGETFETVKSWVNTLQEAVVKVIIFITAGNKFDLSDKNMITKNDEQVNAYYEQEQT